MTGVSDYIGKKEEWLALLKSDVSAFNAEREKYTQRVDWSVRGIFRLSSIDLSGVDLRDVDLSNAKLNWANLQGADLRNTNLSQDNNLSGTMLEGAKGVVVVSEDAINEKSNAVIGKSSSEVERDRFDRKMVLVDQGQEGIKVKRGPCMFENIESVFAHWDNYEYRRAAQGRGVDEGSLATLKQQRKTVMLPLLVGALQEAIVAHESEKAAGETEPAFPKAREIFDELKEQYQDKYPDLFRDTPAVQASAAEARHGGGIGGAGADIVKGGGRE